MNVDVKTSLLTRMSKTHSSTREILAEVDLEICVFPVTNWRIRDILGHIATWDRVLANALKAYKEDSQFVVIQEWDNEEVEFNNRAVLEQSKLSAEALVDEWEQAHKDFKDALSEMPLEKFFGDYVYPWADEQGDIVSLVEIMIDHNAGHLEDISRAIEENK
jgi:hypothetical protein